MYLPTSAGVLVILSMTGPEAVGKYIYVSERPPGNIISSFNFKNHLNPAWVCQLMGMTIEQIFYVHLETE